MVVKIAPLFLVFGLVSSATFLAKRPEIPREFAGQTGCYIKEIHNMLAFGTSVEPIGICVSIGCGRRYIDYATCGVVNVDDNDRAACYITDEDISRPYPECCPQVKCEENNLV